MQSGGLWSAFRRSLIANGSRPALSFNDSVWTYHDLAQVVSGAIDALRDRGVEKGDRLLLLVGNDPSFPVYDLAGMALGAVKVPLSPMVTAADVEDIVHRVRPKVAVAGPAFLSVFAGLDDAPQLIKPELSAGSADLPSPDSRVNAEDPAVVYFTGGTTGRPKGIVHTQHGTEMNLWAHLLEGDIRSDERVLLTTPLSHAAGLFTLATLLRGAFARVENGFEASKMIDAIDKSDITWTFMVPTMIYRLMDVAEKRQWRARSLRTIIYGAAPIDSSQLRRGLQLLGPVFQQLYGQTECPNFATVLRKDEHVLAASRAEILKSCGKASVMCEVRVLKEDSSAAVTGEVGEVCVRAPYIMSAYWDDQPAFLKRFHGQWLRTGDLGYADDEGRIFLVDRLSDMIISGGMNVYSVEVEQALGTHPGVAQVAVVGVPDSDWGESVYAAVVPVSGFDGVPKLYDHCVSVLASYKRPKKIEMVEELPLTQYGKVDKKQLRDRFWHGLSRQIN